MADTKRRCAECGAPYLAWDAYCSSCGAQLVQLPPDEEEVLDGIPLSDWHIFIDKNASRYMEIFAKHKDAKVFFHTNWAATFYFTHWMFYRKMYKYAIILLVVNLLVCLAAFSVVLTAFKPEMEAAESILAPYSRYLDENGGQQLLYYEDAAVVDAVQNAVRKYEAAMDVVKRGMIIWVLLPTVLFRVVFGLLADCLYRTYVRRHIGRTSGGTSGWALAAGVALYMLFNRVIETPLLNLVVEKLLE